MKQIHSTYLVILLVLLNCTLFSCTDDNGLKPVKLPDNIDGYVQKGPFSTGSQITIQELDDKLSPNGKIFQTSTNDDFGSFELNTEFTSKYIEVVASGFYFNEVKGSLSPANLSLRAITDITTDTVVNVNILTTLEAKRIVYLINEKGKSFTEAKQQAETEVLGLFHIETEDPTDFVQMDISKEGEANAILLAVSAILQGQLSVGDLSELINKISLDIEQDGTIDNADHTNVIRQHSMDLNMEKVRLNLENRYNSLGLTVSIPVFEDYIDSDGDSIINKFDTSVKFDPIANAELNTEYTSNTILIRLPKDTTSTLAIISNGNIVLNGEEMNSLSCMVSTGDSLAIRLTSGISYNDTAVCRLLVNNNTGDFLIINKDPIVNGWTLATENPGWSGRWLHSSFEFDNKLWVLGGYGSRYPEEGPYYNDVWCSSDGIEWTEVTDSADWSPRCAQASLVFDDKIWVLGGYTETVTVKRDSFMIIDTITEVSPTNDVWCSSDGKEWTQVCSSAPWQPRCLLKNMVYDEKIWIFGGATNSGDPWDYEDGKTICDIWCSSDGINWIQVADSTNYPLPDNASFVSFEDKLWALGENNEIWYSLNGKDWSQLIDVHTDWITTDFNYAFHPIVSDNHVWIINDPDPKIWYSKDMITWCFVHKNNSLAFQWFFQTATFMNQIFITGGRRIGEVLSHVYHSQ